MIRIQNLGKIYRSRKRNNCKALDNVNLLLPDNGLVFVLGKSGSGKSTLLNLIGGLDKITEGKILVDGNELSTLSERKLVRYRNNHVGFIFQDYHLLDELTVSENVAYSMHLRKVEDPFAVEAALEKVGLSGYGSRFPSELSGGERQRVAIARAIVKKPRIILADEPTGNLDPKTARAVLEILKGLSKECLVLIVSHNIDDADRFADRIIELSKGEVISDYSKNKSYCDTLQYREDTLFYPMDRILTQEDVEDINKGLHSGSLKRIIRRTDKFHKTREEPVEETAVAIEKNNLSLKNLVFLSLKFLKNKLFRIAFSSFMVAVIMVCLSLAQTIVHFEDNAVISEYMQDEKLESLFVRKSAGETAQLVLGQKFNAHASESDIQAMLDAGYKGNIHPVLSYVLPITSHSNAIGIGRNYFSNSVYMSETIGMMIVDEAFLERQFGEVNYLLKAEEQSPIGVFITDYTADVILHSNRLYKDKTYLDLLGEYHYQSDNYTYMYINGIIETNYREKHAELFERYDNGDFKNAVALHEDLGFLNFTNEVFENLGFTYSLNPNFLQDFAGNRMHDRMYHHKLLINGEREYYTVSSAHVTYDKSGKLNLGEGEVAFNYARYNEIFGTAYTNATLDTFVPHTVHLKQFMCADLINEYPMMEMEVTVVALTSSTNALSGLLVADDATYRAFSEHSLYNLGLYFDDGQSASAVFDLLPRLNYEHQIIAIEGVHTMTKAVEVFVSIFELVNAVLCAAVVFILMSFAMKMIKDKNHDIGILKALGTRNTSLCVIFGLQIFVIAILTILLATVGYAIFIDLANDVLVESLKRIASGRVVLDLHFLRFNTQVAFFNAGLVVILSVLSLVVPMFRIRRIQPVKIIKAKE